MEAPQLAGGGPPKQGETPKTEPQPKGEPKQQKGEGEPKQKEGEKKPYKPCFLAGTLVRTQGASVPIESIGVGDLVLGAPLPEWRLGVHEVTGLHIGTTRTVLAIGIDGHRVRCTAGHRFLVPERGWVRADELAVGHAVRTELGHDVAISEVERVRLDGYTATYDLDVSGVENYFVGVGGHWVLVHNGGPAQGDDYNRTYYWHFSQKPKVREDDRDGLSVWKTSNRDEVNTMMHRRVNEMDRSPKSDQYLRMSEEELTVAGLAHHKTDSKDELQTKYGLEHHSVRPAGIPEGKELSKAEQAALQERLDLREKNEQERAADIKARSGQENEKVPQKWARVRPKDVTGCDDWNPPQGA